jgi:lysyl endopeptidase
MPRFQFDPHLRRAIACALLLPSCAFAADRVAPAAPGVDRIARVALRAPRIPDVAAERVSPLDEHRARPRRFAVGIPTNITTRNGTWQQRPDGRWAWRVQVQSAGATSLNFAIEKLHLPPNAQLYVRGGAATVVGPIQSQDVAGQRLWTPLIPGDAATIEVVTDAALRNQLSLVVSKVNHGFLRLAEALMEPSGSCQVDVACSTDDGWSEQARAVVVYTFGGEFSCTGTLVNNTARDQTPYVLTAGHCIETAAQADSAVFYWNYQASACGSGDGTLDQTQSGADLVAHSELAITDGGSDFTLLRLRQRPDPAFRVFYSGWDRRDLAPATGVVGIHHPHGDEKKISRSTAPTEIVSIYGDTLATAASDLLPFLFLPRWTEGTMEYGSSGSGLWNDAHRLVGHYTGGLSGCEAPDQFDLFGRFHSDWSGSTSFTGSVAPHLDPVGSGELAIDGLDPSAGTRKRAPPQDGRRQAKVDGFLP